MSSSEGVTPLGVSYDLAVGPLLIGVVFNALLFGVCVMQLISYFMTGYQDGWKIVTLLIWVYALDTFQVASSISMLWHYIVTNFANPTALAYSPWEYATLPIFSCLASVPIQHFMAYRIMRFSGSKLLFAFVSFLSLTQAGLGITSAIQGVFNTSIASHQKIIPYADAWLALSAACDLSITVLLLYYLLKSRTGFERTDSIIATICLTTVKAAVPVTVLCILDLVFLTTTPNNNLHYMCALPVGRLYTNTLMSTLNDRKHLRSQMENSTPNRGISLAALTTSKHRFQINPAQVRINIERNTAVDMDPGAYPRRSSLSPTSYSPYSPYTPNSPHHAGPRHWSTSRVRMDLDDMNDELRATKDAKDIDAIAESVDDKYDIAAADVEAGTDVDSKASPIAESPNESAQRVVVSNLPRENGGETNAAESEESGGVKYDRVGYGY